MRIRDCARAHVPKNWGTWGLGTSNCGLGFRVRIVVQVWGKYMIIGYLDRQGLWGGLCGVLIHLDWTEVYLLRHAGEVEHVWVILYVC